MLKETLRAEVQVLSTTTLCKGMHELLHMILIRSGPQNRARKILATRMMTKSQRVTLFSTND